ncbi:MAG: class I SAM-dependent methyltransferase, partial [Rhodanobacteraceae bacterium]
NIPFYPPGADVLGIDISPAMLARAARRRGQSLASIELQEMDVTRLGLPDAGFDAAVATFLFCVLPDDQLLPALRELGRVVKPRGAIRLLEYVRPRRPGSRFVARLWEPWMAWAYGASLDRDIERRIADAGLELTDARFVVRDLVKLIEARVPGPSGSAPR